MTLDQHAAVLNAIAAVFGDEKSKRAVADWREQLMGRLQPETGPAENKSLKSNRKAIAAALRKMGAR